MITTLKRVAMALVTAPAALWADLEREMATASVSKRLEQAREQLDEVRAGIRSAKVRMALTVDEAEAQDARDELGHLLAAEMQLLDDLRRLHKNLMEIAQP